MKKKIWIAITVAVVTFAVLFVPKPGNIYKDGGTREYNALTYKIVKWNRLSEEGSYSKTQVYFFPESLKSIDELWQEEAQNMPLKLNGTILEISGDTVLVTPLEGETELQTADKISFSKKDLAEIEAEAGSLVEVTYTGGIMESYPAQIVATSWKIADTFRNLEFTEQWLDKNTAEKYDNNIFDHIRITKIYANCFFARPVIAMPQEIKLNGILSADWCVGDQITCTYENTYYDSETNRVEADMLTVEASTWQPDPNACYKPVIYLYPEEEAQVSVSLDLLGKLTCTYPAYQNGWRVTAAPDGTLTDDKGQTYNYLYWEGETTTQWDMAKGFCVKGTDTATFLEDALNKLGLTRREANEFIVYWLPAMEQNPYNIISFQESTYTDAAKLSVFPAPDTVIRVFMAYKATDSFVDIPQQELSTPQRKGFTVVEWGGTEIE